MTPLKWLLSRSQWNLHFQLQPASSNCLLGNFCDNLSWTIYPWDKDTLPLKYFVPLAPRTPTSFSFSTCFIGCFFSVPFPDSFSSSLQRLDSLSQSHNYRNNTESSCQIRLKGILDVTLCHAFLMTSRVWVKMRHQQTTEKSGSFSRLRCFSVYQGVLQARFNKWSLREVHGMIMNVQSLNYISYPITHHSRNHSSLTYFLLNVFHS